MSLSSDSGLTLKNRGEPQVLFWGAHLSGVSCTACENCKSLRTQRPRAHHSCGSGNGPGAAARLGTLRGPCQQGRSPTTAEDGPSPRGARTGQDPWGSWATLSTADLARASCPSGGASQVRMRAYSPWPGLTSQPSHCPGCTAGPCGPASLAMSKNEASGSQVTHLLLIQVLMEKSEHRRLS